jgi:hypothetical protein
VIVAIAIIARRSPVDNRHHSHDYNHYCGDVGCSVGDFVAPLEDFAALLEGALGDCIAGAGACVPDSACGSIGISGSTPPLPGVSDEEGGGPLEGPALAAPAVSATTAAASNKLVLFIIVFSLVGTGASFRGKSGGMGMSLTN